MGNPPKLPCPPFCSAQSASSAPSWRLLTQVLRWVLASALSKMSGRPCEPLGEAMERIDAGWR